MRNQPLKSDVYNGQWVETNPSNIYIRHPYSLLMVLHLRMSAGKIQMLDWFSPTCKWTLILRFFTELSFISYWYLTAFHSMIGISWSFIKMWNNKHFKEQKKHFISKLNPFRFFKLTKSFFFLFAWLGRNQILFEKQLFFLSR